MTFFKFFDTAPRTKSKKVTDLEKAGKSSLLVDAVEAERAARRGDIIEDSPDQKNRRITVKRVGPDS